MYSYEWDVETGGYLLNSSPLHFSKEPRPVYFEELDALGFNQYWTYPSDDKYPIMWSEFNNYYYRGKLIAKTKGGDIYTAPELIIIEKPEYNNEPLKLVDIPCMIRKNSVIMESLTQSTIKKIYNTYCEYKSKIDVFYVAFSGGKDSITVLDLVQRALPHNSFMVLFGDTGMEFPDTYNLVEKTQLFCEENGIRFLTAKSKLRPPESWRIFGPPAAAIRWCCSVHKTSPQINLLRESTGIGNFTGMAFTGIRGDESVARSEYEDVSLGGKHQGQYSCHPIIEWGSAEVYLYIFQNNLSLNEAYKKGNSRASCLVCPMSSGRHEYMKHKCYPAEVDAFLIEIATTSGKVQFSKQEMHNFIAEGNWKKRRSGRELNFGQDKYVVDTTTDPKIIVYDLDIEWVSWAKTIGQLIRVSNEEYTIDYKGHVYRISVKKNAGALHFIVPGCGTSKDDIKFFSLLRSVIIKSLYCVGCGVCIAECKNHCLSIENGVLLISDDCVHCYRCHDVQEHCVRYSSIRNKIGADKKMKGLDRYYSFGIRQSWMSTFVKYQGGEEFWNTDGDGEVANKKKDAFLNFIKDAGLVEYDRKAPGDKYTRCKPTALVEIIEKVGAESETAWGIILTNLAYTPQFNWYIRNINKGENYTIDRIKLLLTDVMDNDSKGLGRRNIADAFKILLIKTPLGRELGLGICDYNEKINASGKETITLNSIVRGNWNNPDPVVILYSLYKFAEACGDYYQFTLTRLLNHNIDSDGISPTQIFGLDRDSMVQLLNGLTVNYPDFISASFTLNLDNITLRSDKSSRDVLELL